jgi:hypothetical protein
MRATQVTQRRVLTDLFAYYFRDYIGYQLGGPHLRAMTSWRERAIKESIT